MVMPDKYAQRDFEQGPQTYTDSRFLDTIFDATGLGEFSGHAKVVDFMAGSGKVALGMQERAIRHNYIVLDSSQGQLDKIHAPSIEKVWGDVRALPFKPDFVDVAIVRYGLKDIPQEQQLEALRSINRVLKPGGVLVIADMVSPEGAQEWNNRQHSLKQQLSGRKIEEEGECHIPTKDEWLKVLQEAGFQADVVANYTSLVATEDWVKGKQITPEQRFRMDATIMGASDAIMKTFNIRIENEDVKIDYPVVVIRAVKLEI